ncbi:MAG: NAD(P)/FAD-dependent oxidoreductase, partial [Bacteroidia bacterium]|nr:NAD(P)/FAD-dependent oxidoreductase [Bacteroidia bacterium]
LELELAKHGYEVIPMDCSFLPLPDGDSLARWSDMNKSRREIARFSKKDAEVYPEFGTMMTHMGKLAKEIIDHPAPDVSSIHPKELANMLRLGNVFKDLGPELLHFNTKLLTMSAVDFLDMWFESDILKAPMSVSGIIGTFQGVRSPGTAYVLLHHYMGELDGAFRSWGFSKGGTGGISMACANSAISYGAEIKTEAGVNQAKIKNGKCTGVVLENGDEYEAKIVISNLDPNRTYLRLIGEDNLDDDVISEIKRFKLRGSSGKVNLALDGVPEFSCRPGVGPHIMGDIAICPGIDYLEKAFDQAKYGEFSERPFINAVIPSLTDPSLAPPGKHIMSCFVQYAPYNIKEGPENWPSKREAFGDAVVDTLAEYIPNIKDLILYRQVLTPWDLEQEFGLTEGNIFHGELSLEQLMFQRPMAGYAKYQTPVKNLWMCGSGTHPGGGIMGSPGELSAKTILSKRAC